jgi:hypothetical protein
MFLHMIRVPHAGTVDFERTLRRMATCWLCPPLLPPPPSPFRAGSGGRLVMTRGYTVVFGLAAVWFILGTVFVRQVRGVR